MSRSQISLGPSSAPAPTAAKKIKRSSSSKTRKSPALNKIATAAQPATDGGTPETGQIWVHKRCKRRVKITKVEDRKIFYCYELTSGGNGLWRGKNKTPEQSLMLYPFVTLFSKG